MSAKLYCYIAVFMTGFVYLPAGFCEECERSWNLPSACVCSATTLRCLFTHLRTVPGLSAQHFIKVLDIRYNEIHDVQNGAFRNFGALDTVILSNNAITKLKDDAFTGLSDTKHLWLNSNGLTHVSINAFRGLDRLETIHLEANRLQAIRPETFHGLINVEKIFLQQNELAALPRDVFSRNKKLQRLRLDQNSLRCDCEILWLGKTLRNISSSTATCATPTINAGREVVTLTMDELACEAPKITQETSDTEMDIGQSIQLDCRATGRPSPSIVWMHNDHEIGVGGSNQHRFVTDGGNLQVDFTDSTAEGAYQCMAKSPLGDVMGRKVYIRDRRQSHPPRFLQPAQGARQLVFEQVPQGFDVRDGESIQIPCEVSGFPIPEITWQHDGRPVISGQNGVKITSFGMLDIEKPGRSHNGVFECIARNIHNTIRASARVRVRVRPVLLEAPTDSVGYIGGRMTFRCRADGFPAPSLTWVHNGNPTPTTFVHDISRDGTELTFLNVSREDEGAYRCIAQNSAGTAAASAILTVYDDVGDVTDDGDVGENIIPHVAAAVDQASRTQPLPIQGPQNPLQPANFRQVSQLTLIELEQWRKRTEPVRGTFERSLRMMDEKIKRGMIFDNLPGFVYNETLPFEQVQLIGELSGCRVHRKVEKDCSGCYHKKYRTFDGTCNNLKKPMQGASFTGLRRVVPPVYDDGLSQPVGTQTEKLYHGFRKPSARLVSTKVLTTTKVTSDSRHSHMLMQWGQFLDHDLSFTIMSHSHEAFTSHANCKSSCTTENPCFPIPIPRDDPRMGNETCLEFIRSRPICGSGGTSVLFSQLMPREQVNSLTSYIDGSMIYGSSEEVSRHIRDPNSRGLFRGSLPAPGTELPLLPYNDPQTSPEEIDCKRVRNDERNFPCFTAGEIRVNEQLGLLAMHTVWFREHNRIAEKLGELNPQWSGERVFQEARKIVGAQIQHITYAHWIPKILGPLGLHLLGNYSGYRDDVDASIANSFATATLRMGHSTIFPVLRRLNSSFETIPEGDLQLHETFFAPHRVFDQGGIDTLLRGLFAAPAKLLQKTELMNSELTEKLFGMSTRTHRVPLDLGAFNIQRGRDHGLPPYVAFRKFCNLLVPDTFQQLKNEIDAGQLKRLEEVYGHPGNVDLFAGAMSERPLPGAKIGATFMCLLVEQFKRVRDGDRFWYEKEGVFSPEQLRELRTSATLPRILCDNTDTIDRVQKDIFLLANVQGGYSWCEDIPAQDLSQWKECCEDCYLTKNNEPRSANRRLKRETDQKDRERTHLEERIRSLEKLVEDLNSELWATSGQLDKQTHALK